MRHTSKNKEEMQAWSAAYYLANAEARKEYQKRYKSNPNNLKKVKEHGKRYRAAHKAEKKAIKLAHKIEALTYLSTFGDNCIICGSDKKLQWHHVIPDTKKFKISNAVMQGYSLHKIKEELSKCILICEKCHKRIHRDLKAQESEMTSQKSPSALTGGSEQPVHLN